MGKNKHLVHIISSLQRGGAETLLSGLIEELHEFKHHVFYIHDGPIKEELTSRGISVYPIHGHSITYSPYAIYKLIKKIKEIQPICIHSSLWAANILGRTIGFLLGIPVISAIHTVCEHEGPFRNFLERFIPLQPTQYIAVSETVKKSLIETRNIHPSQISIIYNGIDTKQFDSSSGIPVVKKSPEVFVIGSVGRFVPVKNYDLLIKSFAPLAQENSIHLMLVGHGPEEQNLKKLANDLNLSDRVTFVIGKKATDYYPLFDCFVQPSSFEGLSLALLEALYCELPVIVTGYKNGHEIITHDINGIVIPPNNLNELSAALEVLIKEPKTRERLKKSSRATVVDTFTIRAMAHNYRLTIKNITK